MNSIKATLFLCLLLLFSCKKEDSTSNKTSNNGTNDGSHANLSGNYLGSLNYSETDKVTSAVSSSDFDSTIIEAVGTSSPYTLTVKVPGQTDAVVNVNVNGNTFTGNGGTSFLDGDQVSGNLNGDQLTFRFEGEDDSTSWVGSFIGDRPPTGGTGGNGCSSLSISGYSVGAMNDAICNTEFDASFISDRSDYNWHLSVSFADDCDYSLVPAGTYSIVAETQNGLNSTECDISLDLEHTGSNPDDLQLVSINGSGNLTLSFENGKKKLTVSNITLLVKGGSQTHQVSFCAVSSI